MRPSPGGEPACQWNVASEWGRYRLSPDDVQAWAAHGFRANAAYACKTVGLTPEEATMAYEHGEHPALVAARDRREVLPASPSHSIGSRLEVTTVAAARWRSTINS